MSTSTWETYGKAGGIEECSKSAVVVSHHEYLPVEPLTYAKTIYNQETGEFRVEMFSEVFRDLDRLCAEPFKRIARTTRYRLCDRCGRPYVPNRPDRKLCGRACMARLLRLAPARRRRAV